LRSAAQIAQVEASLKSQKATLELQEKRLEELKHQVELTKIYAPQDGLVVYASSSNPGNGILIEEGATVRQKQDIIKLPDVSQMMIEIRVPETHVQKIRPGLSAYVTIDSVPDQQFRGTVRKIGVLPDSSSRYYNPNLKVYATEILLENELADLKPGISGRAEVIITNLRDVLTVPIQAVTTMKGQQVCLVEKGKVVQPVPVEIGMFNDKLIEIKSGLVEGDMVMLSALASSDNIDLSGSIVGTNQSASKKRKGAAKQQVAKSTVTEKPAVPVSEKKAPISNAKTNPVPVEAQDYPKTNHIATTSSPRLQPVP
jgi:HlyD family secretion protein